MLFNDCLNSIFLYSIDRWGREGKEGNGRDIMKRLAEAAAAPGIGFAATLILINVVAELERGMV